jgi:excisionase family DNA binding protein
MNPKLTAERLSRKAIIYVRQSTPGQVLHNQESQRRQYGLVDRARELGFQDVVVIDEDLGRTGSGLTERPGFQRMVAEVCTGEVGAVFSLEASRLARNGRDWHSLIELCGLLGAVVVDSDGVYDPALINDRLLLGLKGTMSELELNLIRQRSLEAQRQKAGRGELQLHLPVGYVWGSSKRVEMDPDRRVHQALQLVFSKMNEFGSVRQVLFWFRQERITLPAQAYGQPDFEIVWKLPVYNTLRRILTNPMYAGAYAFGKTGARTKMVDGHARKTVGHRKAQKDWTVLIRDHHPGYISWEQFERNQAIIAANAHMKSRMEPKAGRGGRALLAGLLRCYRCGRMLHVAYGSVRRGPFARYHCRGALVNHGEGSCIAFGALRPDEAVAREILRVVGDNAIQAAIEAAEQIRKQRQEYRRALEMELEQACYEAKLAQRRYKATDPDHRLVAAELESRWNAALQKTRDVQGRLHTFDSEPSSTPVPDKEVLLQLAEDLPEIWNASSTDMRLKQRIVHILIHEIIADVDEAKGEIVLVIHWSGGRHSELRLKKNRSGQHSRCNDAEAIEIIRQMAGRFADEQIAATLNRLRLRTGAGNTWNERRVYSVRHKQELPSFNAGQDGARMLTLEQAAERLQVSPERVRRMMEQGLLPANQVVAGAPWQIPAEALESEALQNALSRRSGIPHRERAEGQEYLFSED